MTTAPRLTPEQLRGVEDALFGLQSALLGRSLYGPDHPTLRTHLETSAALFNKITQQVGRLRVLHIDDRVVAGGQRLEASARLIEGFFSALAAHGPDGLSFAPGVDARELQALIDPLDGAPGDGRPTALDSAHIRVAYLEGEAGSSEQTDGPSDEPVTRAVIRQTADSLAPVWTGIAQGRDPDPRLLGQLVDQISAAARLNGRAMLPLADLKHHDEYTYVHAVNVGILAGGLAQALGLPSHHAYDVTLAAVLHDVGKKEVPLDILNKAGKLEEHELRTMRRHPVDGARRLYEAPGVPEIAPVVAFEHHMHLDGSGYPHVRPGYRTHLASQIVQVADVFDALRTDRPYRDALPVGQAKGIMLAGPDARFDAEILSVFFEQVVPQSARDGDDVVQRAA